MLVRTMSGTLGATLDPVGADSLAALTAVDTALSVVAGRELLTGQEALDIMRGIRTHLDSGEAGALLDEAIATYEHDSLIAGSKLVDALLDVRLALVGDPEPQRDLRP